MATKAQHNKLASNALMVPAFQHPAAVLVAVKTKPAAAGAAGLDGHLRAAARASQGRGERMAQVEQKDWGSPPILDRP